VAALEPGARRWVEQTLARLTPDEKVGQLVMPGVDSTYLPTDSEAFRRVEALVKGGKVGGVLVFGGNEAVPGVLLNPTYGSGVVLGDPLSAAATLNRLQRAASVPLLNAGDFEWGVGMRIRGATQFPRAMAFGAAGDVRLAEEAGRITGAEMRAIGVHVDFAPVADVNNNPRNPVINTRSFGEDPARVGALAAAFARGLAHAGVVSTLKHFPGHGDTDVDTHLGLATVPHGRARLDEIELAPFRAALGAGTPAVMIGHIELPAAEPQKGLPATLSARVVDGLLRRELGFGGLVLTDSMSMHAVAKMMPPGEAAVRAVEAGNDVVLHPPDDRAALDGLREAVRSGRLSAARIDSSVRRLLETKARLGLHASRVVPLDALADVVGGAAHRAVAQAVSERAVTLVRDEHRAVPLALPADAAVLHLSVLDYPANWRIAAPGRTLVPALRARWPRLTAVELSDRSTAAELDLVRATAPRYAAVVVAVYVRAASSSGRLELSPGLVGLLNALARAAGSAQPFVTVFFGNPYVTASLVDVPAALLTYDFGDLAEQSAARALAGEIAIQGRLPIAIPEVGAVGDGLERPAR
jgi:beta-glucosidase-like glycosyl hydrolase